MKAVFFLSIFLGSCLLFFVQPMMAKALLPLVGGAPAVWIVSMLFFQVMLLAGYGYAAIGSALLRPKHQLLLHVSLYLVAITMLPIELDMNTQAHASQPERSVLMALLFSVGFPYFLLSSNATLVQRWYYHRYESSPYFLFSISNVGSLLGLLGYPFLIEWLFALDAQMVGWSGVFGALCVGLLVMLVSLFRHQGGGSGQIQSLGKTLPIKTTLWVIALGFVPCSLFLSTTLFITTDIASFPLLWVIPLALYIISFIVVFSERCERMIHLAQKLHIAGLLMMAITLAIPGKSVLWLAIQLAIQFVAFFVIAISCHGRAAQMKPEPERLTAYFFWLSFGGALGGLFNTLAPYLFDSMIEYFIVLVISLIAIPTSQLHAKPAILPIIHKPMPRQLTLALTVILIAGMSAYMILEVLKKENQLFAGRSFFGVSLVWYDEEKKANMFRHGTTVHGFQPIEEEHRLNVTSYYYPIQSMLRQFPDTFFEKPLGVLGLGAGVVACYGRKGQELDFYEIDKLVIDIARDDSLFTYLRDCPPEISTILGDGRLELLKQPNHRYQLLVMDAFTSDAVPIHLLTKEAIGIYVDKVVPTTGLLAFNISNRFLDLRDVIANAANTYKWQTFYQDFAADEERPFTYPSSWMVAVPSDSPWISRIEASGFKRYEAAPDSPIWTDDYSNLLAILK